MEIVIAIAAFVAAVAILFVAIRWLARALFGPGRRLEGEMESRHWKVACRAERSLRMSSTARERRSATASPDLYS